MQKVIVKIDLSPQIVQKTSGSMRKPIGFHQQLQDNIIAQFASAVEANHAVIQLEKAGLDISKISLTTPIRKAGTAGGGYWQRRTRVLNIFSRQLIHSGSASPTSLEILFLIQGERK